ncbi:MAG: uridine kinase [bacterium]|nr:uridine kinase [bacterium]
MKPFILGIAGGTGSGKTTIAQKVKDHFNSQVIYIPHDRYYKDQSAKSLKEREKTNYDHPDSLDTDMFVSQLKELMAGKTIEVPEYDFTLHTRDLEKTTRVSPAPFILIEGILIFHEQALRDLIDLKIYVDVPADIRALRRTKRDIEERGRTLDFCYAQYVTFTRPMHEKFVEPSKEYADIIVPRGGKNEQAVSTLIHTIEKRLK